MSIVVLTTIFYEYKVLSLNAYSGKRCILNMKGV